MRDLSLSMKTSHIGHKGNRVTRIKTAQQISQNSGYLSRWQCIHQDEELFDRLFTKRGKLRDCFEDAHDPAALCSAGLARIANRRSSFTPTPCPSNARRARSRATMLG